MKIIYVAAAVALTLLPATAQARHHHSHHHYSHNKRYPATIVTQAPAYSFTGDDRYAMAQIPQNAPTASPVTAGGRPSGCPRLWCGCGTSLRVFGRIIPELNLAANWRRFPSAMAAAGMVAWRWGHVFYIEAVYGNGTVLAYDPNSGHHQAHIHVRSLAGFRVVNPHAQLAMR